MSANFFALLRKPMSFLQGCGCTELLNTVISREAVILTTRIIAKDSTVLCSKPESEVRKKESESKLAYN